MRTQTKNRIQSIYPLSPLQSGMLYTWIADRKARSYIELLKSDFQEVLDPDLLRQSLGYVMDRHEVLRSLVRYAGLPRPALVVLNERSPQFDVVDSPACSPEAKAVVFAEQDESMLNLGFDLTRDVLLRMRLVRLGDGTCRLIIAFHHIIIDGESAGVLFSELLRTYTILEEGGSPSAKPALGFGTFLKEAGNARVSADLLDRVSYATVPTPFPGSRGSAGDVGQRAEHRVELSADLTRRVDELAAENGTTPNAVFQAAWASLLASYHSADHTVHGIVTNNRPVGATDSLGLFINTLPLIVDTSPNHSFTEVLCDTSRAILEVMVSGMAPLADVHAESPLRQNLVDHVVVFENFSIGHLAGDSGVFCGRRLVNYDFTERTDRDFTLYIFPGRRYRMQAIFNLAAVPAAFVERAFVHLIRILEQVTSDSSRTVGELDLLSPEERHRLVVELQRSESPLLADHDVVEMVHHHAINHGSAVAVRGADGLLTYRELWDRATAVADRLIGMGVESGDRVAAILPRRLELLVGLLGIQLAGASYIPLDPEYPWERIKAILDDSGAELLLGSAEQGELAGLRCLDPATVRPVSSPVLPERNLDAEAYLIYTSGTTGRPKGISISHRNVLNFVGGMRESTGLEDASTFLCLTTISFDIFVLESWVPLALGGTVVLIDEKQAQRPEDVAAVVAEGVDVVQLTPSRARMFLDVCGPGFFTGVRRVLIGGEAFPTELQGVLTALPGSEVYNVYGPTETTVWSTVEHVRADEPIGIGRPIANTTVHVVGHSGKLLPEGLVGELCIGGLGVSSGYQRLDALTAERFVLLRDTGERVYRTGDLARWRSDGSLECLGRADHQVKVRGYRIELGEVEQALEHMVGISSAGAWISADSRGESVLHAAYVAAQDPGSTAILDHLANLLPAYMLPATVTCLASLPETPNGKLDRSALARQVSVRVAAAPPESETQKMLHAIWCEVLNTDNLGIDDNFYAAGGQSIYLIQILGRISRDLNRDLTVREFTAAPTIRRLAEILDSTGSTVYPRVQPEPYHRGKPYELTGIQSAYLLGRDVKDGIGTRVYYEVEGAVDIRRLEVAIRAVVARHPLLRTVFNAEGTQQELLKVPEFHIQVEETSELRGDGLNAALDRVRREVMETTHPVGVWPLFDVRAVCLDDERVRLFVAVDMLIADATSLQIIQQEIAVAMNDVDALPPAPQLTFQDYQRAMAELRKSPLYAEDRTYWQRQIENLPPAPALPLSAEPSSVGQHRFARLSAELDAATWSKIKRRAAEWEVSPSAILLTAYGMVLARWNNQPRMTMNLTLFNRFPVHPDVERIVGDFTSVLLVDLDLERSAEFDEFCRATQARLNAALDHRHYDGVDVIRDYAARHKQVGDAVMPVVLTALLADAGEEETGSSEVETVFSITQTSQVLLDNQASVSCGCLRLSWDYVEQVFESHQIRTMFDQYVELLRRQGVESDDVLNSPVLEDPRFASYNESWEPIPARTLNDLVADQIARTPAAPAVVHHDKIINYAELDTLANQIAHDLGRRGVKRGDAVGVMAFRRPETVAAVLGILRAGAFYVPVDPSHPAERCRSIFADAGADFVIGDDPAYWADVVTLPGEPTGIVVHPDDIAYVIYTSGSTGRPKGVVIQHAAAANTIQNVNQRFSVGPADRIIALSSMCFDLSVYDIFGALSSGAVLTLVDDQRDSAEIDRCARSGVTIWNSVPAILAMYLDRLRPDELLLDLRVILLSGDWIPISLPAKIRKHCPNAKIYSLGGATEAAIWSIWFPIGAVDEAWTSIPYGYPMANQQLWVLDYADRLCPVGVTGEICIGGMGVALGYLNDVSRTAAAFFDHPKLGRLYRTGDFGRWRTDEEGALRMEILGRRDNQIKIRGYRVELGEIEKTLAANEFVDRALVSYSRVSSERQSLIAYFTAFDVITEEELRVHLQRALPEYMIPEYFIELDAFPLTRNNKIDMKALPLPEHVGAEMADPPVGDVEVRLAEIWCSQLSVSGVGRNQDYYELGGTSLDAARILNAVEREFGIAVPLRQILSQPTVAGVGEFIKQALATVETIPHGDDRIVLLSDYDSTRENLFFIHAGNGEVASYTTLATDLNDRFNVWAVGAAPLDGLAPEHRSVPEIAATYVNSIRSVQPEGPYRLGGWCVGGTFAHGMAALLEDQGCEVKHLYLLNSYAPQASFFGDRDTVSLDEEVAQATAVAQAFGCPLDLQGVESMEEVWQRSLKSMVFLDEREVGNFVLGTLPPDVLPIIPHHDSQSIEQLIYYINMIKTLSYARARYLPEGRVVHAPVTFIGASSSRIANREEWAHYFSSAPAMVDVDASHFTLLVEPAVHQVAEILMEVK